jgi:urea transport system substrate-binding protein
MHKTHFLRQQKDIAMHSTIGAGPPLGRRSVLALAGLALGLSAAPALAQGPGGDTIKVGVLHSLSGTMAISETTLSDVMRMLIEEQNKKGGLLGKKLEAVVVDPGGGPNWALFAEKARELITQHKVAAVFG